ncbi:hypothetical protein JAAARDRAFT_195313 [Jaapia argillacea MUCL 33604]|uniref:MYND-type domain-containing protein n=1 Tax=Jaapia argillacea MUCL 33604 TaxID=933084 RepID=A0A067PMR8_9AGAM|nr:hypothetical protein JAAARDRAFT_195313 [Jaapia argillacea MUCL 33604]
MPSASANRKQSTKFKGEAATGNALARLFTDDLSDVEWVEIANRLSEVLELPDMTTRKGLKKLHANFPEVHQRLNEVLRHSKKTHDAKVMGGLVGIFAKMCSVDTILQDQILEAGFLKQAMEFLEIPVTRTLTLRALATITNYPGKQCMGELLRYLPTFLRIMKEEPIEPSVAGLCTAIISHTVRASQFSDVQKHVDVSTMTTLVLSCLRNPEITDYTVDHAISLLDRVADNDPKGRDVEALKTFFVALLRSSDPMRRIKAFRSVSHLSLYHTPVASRKSKDEPKVEKSTVGAFALVAPFQKRVLPPDLQQVINNYGKDRCECAVTSRSSSNFVAAYVQHSLHPDHFVLGRTLSREILESEFALPELMCDCCARPRHSSTAATQHWEESLPECVSALRSRGNGGQGDPSDLDLADILEAQQLLLQRKYVDATNLAQKGLERNPDLAYLYYASAFDSNWADKLRCSKKGLRCRILSPWLKRRFLRSACMAAMGLGMDETKIPDPDERAALFMSAYEDSKVLLVETPPDSMHLHEDVGQYILLRLLFDGPDMPVDLGPLEDALEKLRINDKIMTMLGRPISNLTQVNCTRDIITSLHSQAATEWSEVIERLDRVFQPWEEDRITLTKPTGDDHELAKWLVRFEEDRFIKDHPCKISPRRKILTVEKLEMFQCSWCHRISAVLRKCGRCGTTRYCDSDCQKRDWKARHKLQCNDDIAPTLIPVAD